MEIKQDPFEGEVSLGEIRQFKDAQPDTIEDDEEELQQPVGAVSKVASDRQNNTTLTGEPADKVVIEPEIPPINEEVEKHATFAFGRFNPPTVGHEKLIHATEKVAKEHKASAHIIASHSEGNSKNPLPTKAKVGYLKKVAAKGTHVSSSDKEHPSLLQQAAKLHKQGATHLHMVAGSDRVEEYHKLLHKYNGTHEGALYNFKKITVHSAGHRDPDAEGTEGMSGTKMRSLAHAGSHKEFKAGLPKALHPHAKEIADHIRSIKEDIEELEEALTLQQRLRRGLVMKRNSKKLEQARAIARARLAKSIQLRRRALKRARQLVRQRVAGERGKSYGSLATSDKIAIDRLADKRKKQIRKMADRIAPRVKRDEVSRLASIAAGKRVRNTPIPIVSSQEYTDVKIITEKAAAALQNKAAKANVSMDVLAEVFARGIRDTSSKPEHITEQQWAFARVNSYLAEGKAYEMDKDLREAEMSRQDLMTYGIHTARNMEFVNPEAVRPMHTFAQHTDIKRNIKQEKDSITARRKTADVIRRRAGEVTRKIVEDAASNQMRVATKYAQKGQPLLASLHRKVAAAISRGDQTGVIAARQELSQKKKTLAMSKPLGEANAARSTIQRAATRLTRSTSPQLQTVKKQIVNALKGKKYEEFANIVLYLSKRNVDQRIPMESVCVPEEDYIYEEMSWEQWLAIEDTINEQFMDGLVEENNEGRKLNKPFRTSGGPKKFAVYVKNDKGNVIKLGFGDPNLEIKRDDPERRKAYRARHGCDNPGPKWKANYWSCNWSWSASKKVGA